MLDCCCAIYMFHPGLRAEFAVKLNDGILLSGAKSSIATGYSF